jgi:hypothetical protein
MRLQLYWSLVYISTEYNMRLQLYWSHVYISTEYQMYLFTCHASVSRCFERGLIPRVLWWCNGTLTHAILDPGGLAGFQGGNHEWGPVVSLIRRHAGLELPGSGLHGGVYVCVCVVVCEHVCVCVLRSASVCAFGCMFSVYLAVYVCVEKCKLHPCSSSECAA